MARIWTEENKFKTWLEIEILVCEALAELGEIPRDAVDVIRRYPQHVIVRLPHSLGFSAAAMDGRRPNNGEILLKNSSKRWNGSHLMAVFMVDSSSYGTSRILAAGPGCTGDGDAGAASAPGRPGWTVPSAAPDRSRGSASPSRSSAT